MADRKRFNVWPYLFLAPFGVAFLLLNVYPLWRTLAMSTQASAGKSAAWFVGFDNYAYVLRDPLTWLALANTLGYALAFAAIQVPASLGVALLVDASPTRMRKPLAAVFFSTHLIGSAFAGILFASLLSGRRGLLNAALLWAGWIETPLAPLNSTTWAMPVLIAVSVYLGVGFGMVYCLAALRQVDAQLHEAATLDGAGPARRLWHVTLPQVRPTLSFLTIAAVFWGLQAFELPYVLFGGPGPGYRVLTAIMYLFALGFEQGELGLASAVAISFAVVVAVVTIALAKLLGVGRGEVVVG